eukprot:2641549-Ditylum_brightwellii.AAC.1
MTVLNKTGDFVLLLAVDLEKIFEESGVDVFVDFVVGTFNNLVVELDNMMWHGYWDISTLVKASRQKARG